MAVPPKMEPSDVNRAFMEPAPEGNRRRTGSDEFAGEVDEGGREPSVSPSFHHPSPQLTRLPSLNWNQLGGLASS
ncbi:unnamed protein product [Musa acuminata subsp. burmannicoides]